MHVAYVAPSLKPSSGWRSLTVGAIGSLQRHAGVEPLLVVSGEDARAAKELLPNCPRLVVPKTQLLAPGSPWGWPMALATWLRARRVRTEPALVHSLEAYPTGLVGHWLATRLGCPHVITAGGTYAVCWVQAGLDRRIYERVLRRAGVLCPISQGTADLMRRHFAAALDESRLRVIVLGTDRHRKVPRDVAFGRAPAHAPVMLSVGAIKPRKGYEASLRAFALVKARVPDARYRIVGRLDQPDYFETLKQMVVDDDIRDVEFLTDVSDAELDRHYRDASVFLLTPEQHGLAFEGFGLVYLEAGAYGLPVVATASGGVTDAVRHRHTGLLAPPGSVEEIARLILALLQDPELAKRLGRANRQWAERLTWERFAEEQYETHERLLGHVNRGVPCR